MTIIITEVDIYLQNKSSYFTYKIINRSHKSLNHTFSALKLKKI